MFEKFVWYAGLAAMAMAAVSCSRGDTWTKSERALIESKDSIFRVYTVNNAEDSLVLRHSCEDIPVSLLHSPEYEELARKLVATVISPANDGVGIAGPQVGITRRVVAVKRFDKPDEPFEVYPNIRIISRRGARKSCAEGCLSVPDRRGDVLRYHDIEISYTSLSTLRDTIERIKGFPAVIFQHECDHLDGILYTDYNSNLQNNINDMQIILDVQNDAQRRITAIPEGVCSRQIDIVLEGDIIKSVSYVGGCDGNLKAIGALLKDQKVSDAIARLRGITCGRKSTSCSDQLARTLEAVMAK